ncbi:MAG TPA: acetyl-CoA C-acetyltransferase [Candidatus Krumholzibacteria bacterium]|nr:acetyl-CoA C-acetyltransferase [Candidatus Krumholzibacteria bacterium]HRX50167.1 acetyl-CoA C-acetyltransferase [Candidatus Krumholzibacteria bacterium]
MSDRVVICEAVRTPIGRFQGGLSSLKASKLGAVAIRAVLDRSGLDPSLVDEVIMGNVVQAGLGQNPARQAAIWGGVPTNVSAMTLNKVCGSGLRTVMAAAQAIKAGDIRCAIAGGMENMSQIPYALFDARDGMRLGHRQVTDLMIHDGLWDVYNDFHMGMTAELVVEKYGVSRERQDAFAAESHARAAAAMAAGKFAREIVPVEVPQRKGDPVIVDTDEGPRADTTAAGLGKLKPAFKRDGGSVTPGNASTINDGAAAVLVCAESFALEHGLKVRAVIEAYGTGPTDPEWVMMAPVGAVTNVAEKLGVKVTDFEVVELNEAFASQAVAVTEQLGLDPAKVNVHGGAVALGHPIGASGTRCLVTLLHAMEDRDAKLGLVSLCLGGGDAVAMAVRRP